MVINDLIIYLHYICISMYICRYISINLYLCLFLYIYICLFLYIYICVCMCINSGDIRPIHTYIQVLECIRYMSVDKGGGARLLHEVLRHLQQVGVLVGARVLHAGGDLCLRLPEALLHHAASRVRGSGQGDSGGGSRIGRDTRVAPTLCKDWRDPG